MELRAVLEYLPAVGEVVATPGVRRATRAPPGASGQPLRGLESRELSVVRVDRPGPPRRAAMRRRSGHGWKRGRSCLHDRGKLRLDLAEEPAKPPVTQHRHRACRRAGLSRKEIQLQPCGARPEADVAGNVKIAQVVA